MPSSRSAKFWTYGKYKYEAQKKKAEARKKQKVIDVKEIKMRPGIDEHRLPDQDEGHEPLRR